MHVHVYTHVRTKLKKHTYTIDLPLCEQRTRPKSFHAPRSAETGRLLEILFINQTTIAFALTLPPPRRSFWSLRSSSPFQLSFMGGCYITDELNRPSYSLRIVDGKSSNPTGNGRFRKRKI